MQTEIFLIILGYILVIFLDCTTMQRMILQFFFSFLFYVFLSGRISHALLVNNTISRAGASPRRRPAAAA